MLKEKLQQDMKEAMKAGNAVKRMVLSLVNSAIKNKELEKRTKLSKSHSASSGQAGTDVAKLEELSMLSDEEIMDVITSEAKKRKESVESYEKGGREELAQKERDELSILMEYMPEQMSEDEIRELVKQTIKEMGPVRGKTPAEGGLSADHAFKAGRTSNGMGRVLGILMPKLKGRADGQTVSRIVKEELSK